ncbi:MAG: hypothetical protein ABJE95_20800 [Byssovorax sp.]
MSDPERLLDRGSKLEARLLASSADEAPPADLLARTLDFVATAPVPPAAAPGSGGVAAGGAAKTGGLLGAIAVGAALGLVVVGGFELAQRAATPPGAPPPPRAAPSAPTPPAPPAPPPPTATAKAAAPSSPPPLTLAAELALLDQARTALREGDRAGARASLDRYARQIPHGQLAREAALLRAEIEADAAIDAGPTDR